MVSVLLPRHMLVHLRGDVRITYAPMLSLRHLLSSFRQSGGNSRSVCPIFRENQDLIVSHGKHLLTARRSSSNVHANVGPLKKHALTVLRSKQELLDQIDDDDYYTPILKFSNASVGMHFRHSLDHIEKLLSGYALPDTVITYDRRERKSAIEIDRTLAVEKTTELINRIHALPEDAFNEDDLQVSFMADTEGQEYVMRSSLTRELSFVTHHTTHHLAMVKVMMESLGYDIDDVVGKANSTMENQSTQK